MRRRQVRVRGAGRPHRGGRGGTPARRPNGQREERCAGDGKPRGAPSTHARAVSACAHTPRSGRVTTARIGDPFWRRRFLGPRRVIFFGVLLCSPHATHTSLLNPLRPPGPELDIFTRLCVFSLNFAFDKSESGALVSLVPERTRHGGRVRLCAGLHPPAAAVCRARRHPAIGGVGARPAEGPRRRAGCVVCVSRICFASPVQPRRPGGCPHPPPHPLPHPSTHTRTPPSLSHTPHSHTAAPYPHPTP